MYRLHSSPCTAPWNRWVVRDVFYGCDMLRPLNDDQSTFECALRAAKCGKLHLWKESTSVNPRLGTISCQCRCRKEFLKASETQLWSLWGAHCEWRVLILHCEIEKRRLETLGEPNSELRGSPLKRLASLFGPSLTLLEISWKYFRRSSSGFRCAGQVLYYFQEIMTPFWFQNWGESGSGEASKSQAVSDTDFNRFFADFETEMHAFKRKKCVFV